jgi:hypothetical protein
MKKTLAILTVCGLAAATFAQGTFQIGAPASALIGQTNATSWSSFETSQGSPGGAGPGNAINTGMAFPCFYEMLTSSGLSSAPTTLSQFTGTLATAWLDTGIGWTNQTTANGRVAPDLFGNTAGGGNAVAASNWAGGSTQNAMLVGWSANLGTTWAAALANLNNWAVFSQSLVGTAWFGISTSLATGVTPTLASPGTIIIGPGSSQDIDASTGTGHPVILAPLFVVTPEPTTVALAGLGGLALLGLRRRK